MSQKRRFGKLLAQSGIAALLAFGLAACGSGPTDSSTNAGAPDSSAANASFDANSVRISGDSYPMTITDFVGNTITLEQKPERVCVVSGTPLNIYYDAGGTAVCGPNITENLRLVTEHADEMKALPQVGSSYAINMEQLSAQNPDLVITMAGSQDTQLKAMQGLDMTTLSVKVRSFEDLVTTYQLFGAINGTQDIVDQRISDISSQRDEVIAKWPGDDISVAILYVTAQSLAVKLDNSIAGEMATTLGVTNIASELAPDNPGSETTNLDIEAIVAAQPDYVLVTSMIENNDEAKQKLDEQFASNQAWQAVDAVRDGKVIYLPQQYFLFNAGPYYADALEYFAASLRPDVYGQPVDPTDAK
ncbi:ABC transporter substrate-binding protein [Propionimicrobium sp. PCR01-08-3]|uniref:ABC transporter substrate-binding protein n=1 Tax=Propionimicrobium sp. PCR01-08-3 TaxID=3052086 RepID=UPI00255C8518|nr:ABC transporter substrate-binding protein [Propionimicrobium sp. PCR01-08-3]WIY82831.1 ABC transporter substrate-binding protein [Propionimicrobium sp. PCR01-08-3]